jgi:hypothetical protein
MMSWAEAACTSLKGSLEACSLGQDRHTHGTEKKIPIINKDPIEELPCLQKL